MLATITQFAVLVAIAAFLGYWQYSVRRRNLQTWESLIAHLDRELNLRALNEHFPWKEGINATPDQTWDRIGGMNGLFAIYRNASVMLRIADFAFRHADNVDQELLQRIHTDATQIRFCVISAVAQWIISHGTENVRLHTFRAASLYTGLAAHMTELLQTSASSAVPAFVAAA